MFYSLGWYNGEGCSTDPYGGVCLDDEHNIATRTDHHYASADLSDLTSLSITIKAGVDRNNAGTEYQNNASFE